MWFLIAAPIAMALGGWIVFRHVRKLEPKDLGFAIMGLLIYLLVVGIAILPIGNAAIQATTGLLEGYSKGERVGFFTKTSHKGVFWKTYEVQIQVGTGEMAALQSPHPFSVADEKLVKEIRENLGRKARVHYNQWYLLPYRLGDSNYLITKIEWLGEKGGE